MSYLLIGFMLAGPVPAVQEAGIACVAGGRSRREIAAPKDADLVADPAVASAADALTSSRATQACL